MKLILRQAEVTTLTIALDAYLTELAAERGVSKDTMVLESADGSAVDTADIIYHALRDFTLGSHNPRVEGRAYAHGSAYVDKDIPVITSHEMTSRAETLRTMRKYR